MSEDEVDFVHIHHVMDSVQHIFRHYPEDIEKANQYRLSHDYTPYLEHMIMEPDLLEFLELIKDDYRTAISTNRTTTLPKVLELFKLVPYFEMVVSALDVDHPKPHPQALERILDSFGLTAEEAVYIGDSIVDREHSAGIGMELIAFKNPGLPAEYHVNSFMEITRLPLMQKG